VRVHHLALGARNVARVSEFYQEVFELPETARHQYADGTLRSVWLSAEGTLLMIEFSDQPESAQAGSTRPGLFLIAFEVSAARRSLLEQRLEARGAHIERRTEFTSYTRDPEGNQVAISHFPERSEPKGA
jgi:glyoxylase I family protein